MTAPRETAYAARQTTGPATSVARAAGTAHMADYELGPQKGSFLGHSLVGQSTPRSASAAAPPGPIVTGLGTAPHWGAFDFRSVARTAGVSINFLYSNPPLRGRIESLRGQQREATHPTPDPPEGDTTAIVRVLTAKLKDERRRHREEVTALRAELAATHGALLQQRRADATV